MADAAADIDESEVYRAVSGAANVKASSGAGARCGGAALAGCAAPELKYLWVVGAHTLLGPWVGWMALS